MKYKGENIENDKRPAIRVDRVINNTSSQAGSNSSEYFTYRL